MEFTFGIITNNGGNISEVIESIINLNIEKYEVIVVGSLDPSIVDKFNLKFVPYKDDSDNFNISVKKNIITEKSIFENIVYLHDYIKFDENWYSGFLEFGNNFEVCMTKIKSKDGSRYRDWCLWEDDAIKFVSHKNYLIPYDIQNLSNMMYISGAYWIAKKKFMAEHRLNESLKWGQGEDVEWSLRIRNKTSFKLNAGSSVTLIKEKDRIFNETSEEENARLKGIERYDDSESYSDFINKHLNNLI
jgi:glycosyltransferase involved in cell wall biosynthesis